MSKKVKEEPFDAAEEQQNPLQLDNYLLGAIEMAVVKAELEDAADGVRSDTPLAEAVKLEIKIEVESEPEEDNAKPETGAPHMRALRKNSKAYTMYYYIDCTDSRAAVLPSLKWDVLERSLLHRN